MPTTPQQTVDAIVEAFRRKLSEDVSDVEYGLSADEKISDDEIYKAALRLMRNTDWLPRHESET